ncbi:type II glyceraldehyde-3-phosphate dehydrogenase [Methanococcoides burtonii]|uniref:Glyceraldehyde-3-phosphate dehydrogenase n=1 Tax=Methanococcoides burtonii (strain DSM 6242 / NBRC 107633 / OCM 468 / ACE-M) TaxID=259564 RepID=G3P_METBU|nr:type II glyceraldehyde-3-phosphate dehydrogenase [Methanococcoides burtonii]Q12XM4.1 RecName: Full=Glyceraldehyde-3-phosphate dehydrogenase; Short=GAPDH; AltName: Full=NAD(P)-dependent glyceraldehyde-3-phosphate dehydrogenase [Methanococcoides burtonii DSM 6242]ABE51802.1 glyceraldehyde-3-phosphate dehydrogenase [Methanococcoides burtonii DSM 6242]
MTKVKVAINGYGTIGKRVADAVALQDDMEIIGIAKTRPNFETVMAKDKGFNVYTLADRVGAMEKEGIEVSGTVEEMIKAADVVVDCTPGKVGATNKDLYEKAGIKAIWQGGEAHTLTGCSFNAETNYDEALGKDFVRVVSCNTTGLCRVLSPLDKEFGVKKARVTLLRRAADPGDIKTGPINAIVPNPIKLPSHHGPDVKTVIPNIDIATTAVKLPTTLMHLHTINLELEKECTAEDVESVLAEQSRVRFVGQGITSTAEIMELAKDLGRSRGDMWENCIWNESITMYEGELYFFQAIHQESDVIPENIDAIRAMMELESDASRSIEITNKTMGI